MLNLVFLIVLAAADGTAIEPRSTPPLPIIHLGDPAVGPALRGSTLRVLRANGVFYQGVVTDSDPVRGLAIDGGAAIPASEVQTIWTLQPAQMPVQPGTVVTATARNQLSFRGQVIEVGLEGLTLQDDAARHVRLKWPAILTLAPEPPGTPIPMLLATPAPIPSAPSPVATPVAALPEPEPRGASFGDAGTFEAGGSFGLFRGTTSQRSSAASSSSKGYQFSVRPIGGYFPIDRLELLAEAGLSSSVTDFSGGGDEWTSNLSFRVGGAWLFGRSAMRFGPQILFGGYSEGGEFQGSDGITYEYEERGWTGTAGLAVKVPIGKSALVTWNAGFYREGYNIEFIPGTSASSYAVKRAGFESRIGFSLWLDPDR